MVVTVTVTKIYGKNDIIQLASSPLFILADYPMHIDALINMESSILFSGAADRERSGSVVECLTRDREAAGSSLAGVSALWSLSKTNLS